MNISKQFNAILHKYINKNDKRWWICSVLPGMMFAFFVVWGYSFEKTSSWDLAVKMDNRHMIKSAMAFVVLWVVFAFATRTLFLLWSNRDSNRLEKAGKGRSYVAILMEKPFITTFATILIAYIPYMILSYPAIFLQNDTLCQITQAYPELGVVAPGYLEGRYLSETIYYNLHHPIMHTLLIHGCLVIGNVIFHSYNIGLFLYSLIQTLSVITVISYAVKVMICEMKVSKYYAMAVIVYYIFSPRIQNYMFLATKDVFYSVFCLLFMISLFLLLRGKYDRKDIIRFLLAGTGMILFRNDAKYVLFITMMILCIFCKELWHISWKYLLYLVIFSAVFFNILMPLCKVTPGSRREMFSVPFQQTARYVRDYGEDVTEEEKEAISKVLAYDFLAENYVPEYSDTIKGLFNEDATTGEIADYFKVWAKMFLKHPSAYLQATMSNYYYYFYPGKRGFAGYGYEDTRTEMNIINDVAGDTGLYFSYPQGLDQLRNGYESLRERTVKIPVWNLIMKPATYTWMLILLLFYAIAKKQKKAILFITMPILILLVCLLGPSNGYYCRYMFSLIFMMPLLLGTGHLS